MTTPGPRSGEQPEDRDGTPSLPEEVWQKFLTDDEHAIRASAPREPSAQERAPQWCPQPPDTDRTEQHAGRPHDDDTLDGTDPVGELWHPEDLWSGPAWRDLDGRARLRRVGRVIGTAAAIALALAAWSQLSTSAGSAGDGPGGTTVQQSEDALDDLPAAPSLLPGHASAGPSSSAVQAG